MVYIKFCSLKIVTIMTSLVISSSYAESEKQQTHAHENGDKHVHGTHLECPLPKDIEDIIKCSLSFHPSVKKGEYELKTSEQFIKKASQLPNPTITSRYVKGDDNGVKVSDLETNLSFKIELGGKRSARMEYASATKTNAIANQENLKSEIKMMTILNLFRLRQVIEEREVINEALTAFTKVIGQLKKLPRLSAQQEASLTLFEIAFEEAKINDSELFEEERKLEHYFHISTGHSLKEIIPFLPKSPKEWPKVTTQKTGKELSPEIKKLEALSLIASKDLEIQRSDAWPDLKIGPSLAIAKEGLSENKKIGINIQIPIPMFHANGGGKSYARSKLIKARKSVAMTQAEESHERHEQLKVYVSAVNILNKTMKKFLINKKHKRIEQLYLRGVVSSSIFLNSLKQKLSYFKSRNNRELTAIKAIWSIYKFDGKILEEKI